MSRTRFWLSAAAVGASLSLAACSSSGSHAANPAPPRSGAGTATHATTGAVIPKSSGDVSIGGNAWCTEFSHAGDAIVALGGSSTQSPQAYLAKAQQLANDAPSAIKPDVEALLAIDKKIVAGDKGAESQLADPAVLGHIRHFAAWLKTNCKGVDIQVPDIPSATR